MENFDFLKLGEVPEVDKLLDTDTVLVVRDGEVYRVPKSQVGGAGGYLIVPEEDEIVQGQSDDELWITTPCQEAFDVIRAGGTVTFAMDAGVFCYMPLLFAAVGGGSEFGLSGDIIGGVTLFADEFVTCYFTNGQAVPSGASATALSADNSPLSKLRSKMGGGSNAVV